MKAQTQALLVAVEFSANQIQSAIKETPND